MNTRSRFLTLLTSSSLVVGVLSSAFAPTAFASVVGTNETGTHANGLTFARYSTTGKATAVAAEANMAINPAGSQIENGSGLASSSPLVVFSPAVVDLASDLSATVPYILVDASAMFDNGGVALNESQNTWKATTTGDARVYLNAGAADGSDATDCSATFADYGTSKGFSAQTDDNVLLCVVPALETSHDTGTVTLIVTNNGDQSTVQTFYFDFYGPVSSIAPVKRWSRLADGASDATQADLSFKDAAGTDLLAKGIAYASVKDCSGAGSDLCSDTVDVEFYLADSYDGNDNATADTADKGAVVLLENTAGFCDENSISAGSSISLYAFMNIDGDSTRDSDEVKSTAWTVSCTHGTTGATITDIALATSTSKASTASMDRTLNLVISVEDSAGADLGYLGDGEDLSMDSTAFAEDYEQMFRANGDAAVVDPSSDMDLGNLVIIDGKAYDSYDGVTATAFTLTVGSSEYFGFNEMIFSLADATVGGTANDPAEFTLEYSVASRVVTLAAVSGHPRTVCATFGRGAAGVQIGFLFEYVKNGLDVVVWKTSYAGLTGKACATSKGAERTITAFWGRQMSNSVLVH